MKLGAKIVLAWSVASMLNTAVHAAGITASTDWKVPFAPYSEKQTGLSFIYPGSSQVAIQPEKDVLVRMSGAFPSGGFYMFSLNRLEFSNGTNPQLAAQYLDKGLFKELKSFQAISAEQKWIGKRSQFPAASRSNSHEMDGKRVYQKWIIFSDPQDNDRLSLLTFFGPEQNRTQIDPLAVRVLSSLEHVTKPGVATKPNVERMRNFSLEGVSVDYPADCKTTIHPDKDTIVKISGYNFETVVGTSRGDLNISVEQLERILEDEYLSKVPRYKKVADSTRSYSGGITGIKQTFTGEMNGMPLLGQAFIFQQGDKLYCMMQTSGALSEADSLKRFDAMASSLKVK
jgi:hypothetical protein